MKLGSMPFWRSVSAALFAAAVTVFAQDQAPPVMQLYGQLDSRSPSTKGGQPLELLYHAFDRAGPDVPQVMQVVCTASGDGEPGRVVEITLAASSL